MEARYMTKMQIDYMDNLNIEFFGSDFVRCHDIRWLAKLSCGKIRELRIISPWRIKEKVLVKVIKRKYDGVSLSSKK